jgi:hypothetical protein
MTDNPPSLTLTIGRNRENKEWEMQSIEAAGNQLLPLSADEVQGKSRPGVEALCLLTLLSYLSRHASPDQPDHIPDRFHPSLAVLYSGNKKSPSKWQDRIFGCQPFAGSATQPVYLEASQVNGRPQVRIAKQITVEVLVTADKDQRSNFRKSDLIKICSLMVTPPENQRVAVEIPVKGRSTILSSECVGNIDRSSRFSIIIEGGVRSDFCVIWIGHDSGISSLYPWSKWPLIYNEEEVKHSDHSKRQRIEITSELLLEIESSKGVEACLVLEKKSKFTKPEIQEIVNSLKTVLSHLPENLNDNKPRFTPLNILRVRFSSRRIKPASKPAEWHEKISTALAGLAEKGHLFEIPFR